MKKRVLTILCLLFLLSIGFSASVSAGITLQTSSYTFVPHWVNTAVMNVDFFIVNGRATMNGIIIGNIGTESISVIIRLERLNANGTTTHIASWNNIRATGNIWMWERPHYVARGHYYRATFTATVVKNEISEVISFDITARAN